jgi:hypothetical protein
VACFYECRFWKVWKERDGKCASSAPLSAPYPPPPTHTPHTLTQVHPQFNGFRVLERHLVIYVTDREIESSKTSSSPTTLRSLQEPLSTPINQTRVG